MTIEDFSVVALAFDIGRLLEASKNA